MKSLRAAEIANDCNEGMTAHLKKSELVEAVRYWALKAADKNANAYQRAMAKIINEARSLSNRKHP